MKSFLIGTAVLAAVASITTIANAETVVRSRNSFAQMPQQVRAHKSMLADKSAVVVNGSVIGRDPHPNIRASLANEYLNRNAGGEGGGGGAE